MEVVFNANIDELFIVELVGFGLNTEEAKVFLSNYPHQGYLRWKLDRLKISKINTLDVLKGMLIKPNRCPIKKFLARNSVKQEAIQEVVQEPKERTIVQIRSEWEKLSGDERDIYVERARSEDSSAPEFLVYAKALELYSCDHEA